MNIITIDPSLSCTAMCVNGELFIYASEALGKNKSGSLKKWFSNVEDHVTFRFIEGLDKDKSYSDSEIDKLCLYNRITDLIISDIALFLATNDDETLICVEGYSYASATSALIDLVTFSTLLRMKIVLDCEVELMVMSPATLKARACEFTYGKKFNTKGRKLPCSNNDGVSGGRFKKPDILKCLVENDKLNDEYVNLLKSQLYDEICKMTNVPKPIEDLNDVKIMYEVLIQFRNESNDITDVKNRCLT